MLLATKLTVMKKIAILALLVSICFVSCQKEHGQEEDSNFHVSFSVDGVSKSFTGYVLAHTDTTSGYVELTILGTPAITSFDNYMGVYLDNFPAKGSIGTGQYQDNGTTYSLLTTYVVNGAEYEAGQSVAADAVSENVTIANPFKLNITSMDKNIARGTFSGDYFKNGDPKNGEKISITKGEFYVKFQ